MKPRVSNYLFDGLGSVVSVTNATGDLVGGAAYKYEPYGRPLNDPLQGRGVSNPWRFAAGYYDEATGMLKFGTRYYMRDVARWTQLDPKWGQASDPMSLNRCASTYHSAVAVVHAMPVYVHPSD